MAYILKCCAICLLGSGEIPVSIFALAEVFVHKAKKVIRVSNDLYRDLIVYIVSIKTDTVFVA